jgi:hypothetical protein
MYSPHVISILVECRPDTMNPHSLDVYKGLQYRACFPIPGFRKAGIPDPGIAIPY